MGAFLLYTLSCLLCSIRNDIYMTQVKLRNYQAFAISEDQSDEALVRTFLGISKEDFNKLKQSEVDNYINDFSKLFDGKAIFFPKFKLDGVEYGFIPKLDDITYGENSDLTTYLSDPKNAHRAMAVAYRPITVMYKDQYDIEEYEGSSKYAEIMKDAPVEVYFGMMVFFYNLTRDLLNYIPNFLNKEMVAANLEISGDDINKFTHSLKVILDGLTKSQSFR